MMRENRLQKYQIQRDDCQLLEKNDAAVNELSIILDEMHLYLYDCAIYLKKHVAFSREDLRDKNSLNIHHFISKHEKKLPASKVAAYGDLKKNSVNWRRGSKTQPININPSVISEWLMACVRNEAKQD